jgi:DNA-binding SARP family transcriptional activator/Tfp pilus assembly protein PilF
MTPLDRPEFGLLGPLVARTSTTDVTLPPGKQRVVLAALLLSGNRVVPVDDLALALWGSAAPPSARATIRNYVRRLRAAFGPADRDRISTRPGGYLIRVAPDELDVSRFEALMSGARAAARASDWEQAAGQAQAALDLWRGEPLADVESATLRLREAPRLTELRLQAVEMRIDAALQLGLHADVIGELHQLAADNPLRERVYVLLMLALYRDGRQAEALAVYRQARAVLVEELGIEPGPELSELHQRMLSGDSVLAVTAHQQAAASTPATGTPGAGSAPRQLPARVPKFTGRERELAVLSGLLDGAGDDHAAAILVTAIGGTAGVGKTALAVHWAHQVSSRFPDGQLYVNLRGYDPGPPVAAPDALAGFLRALGVPGPEIAAEPDERAAQYRSLLADQRMLIVLDNAGSVEQVRPLLPGSRSCTVLVTSRDTLPGLVARDGASRLELDLLPMREAIDLLRRLIGRRVEAEPIAAATLADRCSRLPLALRLAAELAIARPATRLAELCDELAEQQRKLDLLSAGGDPQTAVRAVFSWSLRHLAPGTAGAFRQLGLHPGPDFDAYAVAALADSSLPAAGRMLAELSRAHLVQGMGPGRYSMHDLLRSYAAELAAGEEGEAALRSALTRLFDYYLSTAGAAVDTLLPAERDRRPQLPKPRPPVPPTASQDDARAWLDTERAVLVSMASYCAGHGWPAHAFQLSETLFRYLDVGGRYQEAVAIHQHARAAAVEVGDRAAEAHASAHLAAVDMCRGRYEAAVSHYEPTLELFRLVGDRESEARILGNLGLIYFQQGRYRKAAHDLEQALTLFRELGDAMDEAHTLSGLARMDLRQGRYAKADDRLRRALELYRQIGESALAAYALASSGLASLGQGRYLEADDRLREALEMCRSAGYLPAEAHVLAEMGLVDLARGRYQQAAERFQAALEMCRKIGDRNGETEVLNSLGECSQATADFAQAQAQHALALEMATQMGDTYEQARAHHGLGRSNRATGDHRLARDHASQALALYAELETPEADQVRAWLADLEASGPA